jgi:PknH-like extracellular domain
MPQIRSRTAILLAASVCALAGACSTAPAPPPPPIKASAMDKLLVSPAKAGEITGATLAEVKTSKELVGDTDPSLVSDPHCLGLIQVAGKVEYANSGSTAVRNQQLANTMTAVAQQQSPVTVTQAVVLFPSGQQATALFTAAAKSWPACANKQLTISEPKMKAFGLPSQETMSIGQVSNKDGTLSADVSSSSVISGAALATSCQRVLTVTNNVAIDVSSCSGKLADNAPPPSPAAANAAATIAHDIATNVDDQHGS